MKQGISLILTTVVIAAAAVLVIVLLFALKGNAVNNTSQTAVPAQNQNPQIQSSTGLDSASGDLDSTNVDSMDTDLNQINQDASTF